MLKSYRIYWFNNNKEIRIKKRINGNNTKNQDIPVIGIKTIKNLHKSKIFKIAIEANNCILADKYLDIKKVIEDLKMPLISVNYSS